MRVAIVMLLLFAAGCAKEIRRGELRPDGSRYVSHGLVGNTPSSLEKPRGPSRKPVTAAAKPQVIRAGQGAGSSRQPGETQGPRSFWDWLLGKDKKARERPAPKESK